jgi:hypothetical protein
MKVEDVIRTVNQMKADGVIEDYALGGAVGASFYLEPVSTLGVDVFVEVHASPGSALISLEPLFNYLRERGCELQGEHVIISGWPVQFLPPTGSLVEKALAKAIEISVTPTLAARVFAPEYLAAIALQTGRAKDKVRLLEFIEAGAFEMAGFEKLVDQHHLNDRWKQFRKQFLE